MSIMKFDFEKARKGLFKTGYTQLQVDSINAIVAEAKVHKLTAPQLAYVLATGYLEGYDYDGKSTGKIQRLVPIKEKGGQTYLKAKKYYPYIGFGFVQITWLANYKKFQKPILDRFKVDIIKSPELMLRIDIAAFIIVYGMKNAMFTAYKLSDFINAKGVDYRNARKIVNPKDFKTYNTIAAFADGFSSCIS